MTLEVQDDKGLQIFWDYETTSLNLSAVSGYEAVRRIRSAVHLFGPIQSFKTYHDSSNRPSSNLNSELGSSGVTVIDCPSNGRKEAATKIMIIDIITHAWDHPAPRTIVIITGDRDLAYLIATLRMRKFEVILMSPGTHSNLSIQASVNLDWTAGIDGRKTDRDDLSGGQSLPPTLPRPPSPHLPPSASSFPPPPPLATSGPVGHYAKTDFLSEAQEGIDPSMVESRGIPTTRGRRPSIFPYLYEPDRFNTFGDFGSSGFRSPRPPNRMFGLGDGPLFAHSQSRIPARQVRSDSAPPGIVYSIHSPSSPPNKKGKQREFPITEPEDIAPAQSPWGVKMPEVPPSDSGTGIEERLFANTYFSSAKANASTHSSMTSRDSAFSVIQFPPSTAPTSAEPIHANDDDKTDKSKGPAAIIVIDPTCVRPESPVVRDTEKISSLNRSLPEEMNKAVSTKASPPVDLSTQPQASKRSSPILPTFGNKAPPPKETPVNAKAGPSSKPCAMCVPPQFQVLVETLRKNKGSYPNLSLPGLLLARDPNVYKNAKVSKYTKYIAAAVEAGLVQKISISNHISISLTAEYA